LDIITNIVIAGVGGQGIILASKIISEAIILSGYDVKNNEVHGMAQRGGSVISQIRFGTKVFSPLIQSGSADILLSLEKLETLRYIKFCNSDTNLIINNLEIVPVTVTSGKYKYPKDLNSILTETFKHINIFDADGIAQELGNMRVSNVVLIGAMSNFLSLDDKSFEAAIKNFVKKKYVDINIEAFHKGKKEINIG